MALDPEDRYMLGVYIIGGQQRHARTTLEGELGWYKYGKAMILKIEPETERVECRVEYVSPPDACAEDDPAILFKCGTLHENKLYVCTQTEILVYSVPTFQILERLSLPCFNDVHHVRPTSTDTLLVANSGLDMVLEITHDGEILRAWNTLGEDPWARFTKEIDYRRIASTKPHQSHPNQIFMIGDEIWATRFQQRDAICLTDSSKRIGIGSECVHDGLVHHGYVYFTTVDGRIVIANTETLMVEEVIDLNEMSPSDVLLGWCRGIFVDEGMVWVGFTRLRLTKFRENLSWVRWGFRKHLPTRIACYDLEHRQCIQEIDVQQHGLDAVFSIFPSEGVPETTPGTRDDLVVATPNNEQDR
jgi:hypothetical protein